MTEQPDATAPQPPSPSSASTYQSQHSQPVITCSGRVSHPPERLGYGEEEKGRKLDVQ